MGKHVSKQDYITLIYTEIFNAKAKSWSPLGKRILKKTSQNPVLGND